ncbi:hypothetical protein THAOC_04240 [Thalassiosira oceanica]|uniref:ABM domain-containing protein n=1 Tax=Thalassiosira oceanica TaxID=159749 RepID=K0TJM3_THAOC|nr:hypothetical protein THAOC_04240 [Thalassiosira oceanica]|eukprot:EJK74106.1 hypothetical protein THAOC_04240 [Thalassiosira oceanica]
MSIAVAPFVRTERFKLYCGQEKYLIRNNRTVRASIAMIKSTLIAALLVFWGVESFTAPATARRSSVLASTVEAESPTVGEPIQPPLERDRYVATNRFEVRSGRAAKFEKRWADRSSRLATLDGFKYFQLMRRVSLDNPSNSGIDPQEGEAGNYVSFTIWETKKNFNSWRTGDAFKEAHGGTSLWAFVTTMISSARVLKGAPKPAMYDGLLQQSIVPSSVPEVVDGWRSIEANGKDILPAESFIAMNQFFVPPANGPAFEARWANRVSKLKECEGFVSFSMLRRDVKAKGHGISPMGEEEPTYTSCTVWKSKECFEAWKNGAGFQEAHGKKDGGETKPKQPPAPLWTKPPVPVFYEGTLVISSAEGA